MARRRPRPLRLEALEDRTTPAVTAIQSGGGLTVTLGASNDFAQILGTSSAGTSIEVFGTGFGTQTFTGVSSLLVSGPIGADTTLVAIGDKGGSSRLALPAGQLTINDVNRINLFAESSNPIQADGITMSVGDTISDAEFPTSTGPNLAGNRIRLTAPGGMGSADFPIKIVGTEFTRLSTDSSGGNGNQFLNIGGGFISVDASHGPITAGTGTISLQNGTWLTDGGNACGDSTIFNLASDAALGVSGAERIGGLTGSGQVGSNFGVATVVVGGSGTFNGTFHDLYGTSLGLEKVGAGTLTLPNVGNTFTGNVLVSEGTLNVTAATNTSNPTNSALGNPQIAGRTITVAASATLQFSASDVLGINNSTPLVTMVINGRLTNTGDFSSALGPIQLNGGRLDSVGGVDFGAGSNYRSWNLRGNVTVGGTSPSYITANAFNAKSGVHLGANTIFTVADATGNDGVDLFLSAPLFNQSPDQGNAAGRFTKSGGGTMAIFGNNTYTGGTTIEQGTLNLGDNTLNGTLGTGPVTNNATFDIAYDGDATFGNLITGSGVVRHRTAHRLTLTNDNIYSSGTAVMASGGTLAIGDGGTIGTAGTGPIDLFAGTTLEFNRSDDVTLGHFISGEGNVRHITAATVTLSGESTYSGTTEVTTSGGVLRIGIGASGSIGNGPVSLAADTTLMFARQDTITYGGTISGQGNVLKVTPGIVIFTGNNDYTGTTTIAGGILQIGNGGTTGTLGSGPVVNDGTLVFDRSDIITQSGPISGPGSVTKSGTGTLVFDAQMTYTGGTTVAAGTLAVAGSGSNRLSGSVEVQAAATLSVLSSAALPTGLDAIYLTLRGGALPGTLHLQNASAEVGILNLDGGVVTSTGSPTLTVYARINVTGSPSTITLPGGLGIQSIELQFDVADVSGGNGGDLTIDAPILQGAEEGRIRKYGAGELVLTKASTYAGGTAVHEGIIAFSDAEAFGSGLVAFEGAAGIIATAPLTLDNELSVRSADAVIGSAEAVNGDVTFSGPIELILPDDASTVFLVGGAIPATIFSGAITGTGGIFADRPLLGGTISLASASGANTFTGPVRVGVDSILKVAADDQIPDGAGVLFSPGGSLQMAGNDTIGFLQGLGTVVAAEGAHTLTIGGNNASGFFVGTLQDGTASPLSLRKVGTGKQTLTGNNTYSGATTIEGGTLQIGDASESGTLGTAGVAISEGATLAFGRFGQLNVPFAVANTITGKGKVQQSGAGIIALTANNTYSGGTVIDSDRQLWMGNGGTTGSIGTGGVSVGVNGLMGFNRSDALSLGNVITGNGGVRQVGAGVVTLTGANTFTGHSVIDANRTLRIQNGGIGSVSIGAGGVLDFNLATDLTASGILSGGGSVRQSGNGVVTLTGANTYGGGTTIDASRTLTVGGAVGTIGTGNVANSGQLRLNRTTNLTLPNVISGTGSLTQAGIQAGVVILTGANTYSGGTTINADTTLIASGASGTPGTGTVTNNGILKFSRTADGQFGFAIQGLGSVIQSGIGAITLTGANTYSGGTLVDPGSTLRAGGTANPLGTAAILNDGALIFVLDQPATIPGSITGSGSLQQSGSGVVTLGGDDTSYSGSTTIDTNRILRFGDGNASEKFPSGAIINNGLLEINREGVDAQGNARPPVVIPQAITGTGGLTLHGNTQLTMTGANTYSGSTTITRTSPAVAAGLRIGSGGTTGQLGTGAVVNDGLLLIDRSNDITVSNLISGTGAVFKVGENMLTLTAGNSYSGGTEFTGTLQLSNTGSAGTGTITTHGVLLLNASVGDLGVVSNAIAGNGGLKQAGIVSVDLVGQLTYSGVTTIDAGRRLVVRGTRFESDSVVTNGSLVFSRGTLAFPGVISGSGEVKAESEADVTLTGDNTYSGGTFIEEGSTVRIGDGGQSGNVGAGPISNEGTFVWNRDIQLGSGEIIAVTLGQSITGNGTFHLASGFLEVSGDAFRVSSLVIDSDARLLATGSANSLPNDMIVTLNGDWTIGKDTATKILLGGPISGSGNLALGNNTEVVLTGQNSFTGLTRISPSASLTINRTLGTGPIRNNGTLIFDRFVSGSPDIDNVIENDVTAPNAARTVIFAGSFFGSYNLRESSPFTGTFQIPQGTTLTFSGNGSTAASTIINNGSLALNRLTPVVINSTIQGSGDIVAIGSGLAHLTGNITATGTTTPIEILTGRLRLDGTVNAPNLPAGTPLVSVDRGLLSGTGTINGLVSATSNTWDGIDKIRPGSGDDTGTLTVQDIRLSGAGNVGFFIDGSTGKSSQLIVKGTVDFRGGFINVTQSVVPFAIGSTFTVVRNDGTGAVSGIPPGITEFVDPNGVIYALDALGGDGNDVTLTVRNSPPAITSVADQVVQPGQVIPPLAFTIGDPNDFAGVLTVTAASSNTTLLPVGNIVLSTVGANRTVTVTPVAGQLGTATITLTVTDTAGLTATTTFQVIVQPQNNPPTISAVADKTIPVGTAQTVGFTVQDDLTQGSALIVTAQSSNGGLIRSADFFIQGEGSNRTFHFTPMAGVTGIATITLTVTDESLQTATETFVVTVHYAPTITAIADQTIMMNDRTAPLSFTVADPDHTEQNPVEPPEVFAYSTNTTLIPIPNLVLHGSGSGYVVTVIPAPGQTGTATITVEATDAGGLTATETFTVTVNPPPNLIPEQLIVTGPVGGNGLRFTPSDGSYTVGETRPLIPGFGGEVRSTLGDVNGDGVLDTVAVTGPGSDEVRVIDGQTGQVLTSFQAFGGYPGGLFVSVGDLNGDGKADIAVTPDATDAFGGPVPDQLPVRVYSGNGFSLMASFDGLASLSGASGQNNPLVKLGGRPAIADMNGDGTPDLAIGAGNGGGPRITVWDGKGFANANGGRPTRNPIANLFVFESTQRGGAFIAAGDINGDGKAEIVAGGGPGGGPRVRIVNPAVLLTLFNLEGVDLDDPVNLSNGLVTNNFFAGSGDSRGGVRVAVRDVDRDGRGDVVTGSGTGEHSIVRVYIDEALLASSAPQPTQEFDPFGGVIPGGIWVG